MRVEIKGLGTINVIRGRRSYSWDTTTKDVNLVRFVILAIIVISVTIVAPFPNFESSYLPSFWLSAQRMCLQGITEGESFLVMMCFFLRFLAS